ncbi:MAG TPA: hypothetical protein VHC95_04735 [Opitutales bacterium]|nr:hypothetical protein [Opitutales bacterium]
MLKPRNPLTLPAAALALALAACAPKLYTLNLSPPSQVGWKFALTSSIDEQSHSHTIIQLPGVAGSQSDDRDEQFTGRLEGDGEVIKVYPNGGIQELYVLVKVLEASRGGKVVPNLPGPGAKIVAEREGDKIALSVDGKPADPAATEALNELILLDDEKLTSQQLFGPQAPVSVGSTWPVDPNAVSDVLKSGLGGSADGAKGTMQFKSVDGSGAAQTATLTGDFSTLAYKPAMPSGIVVDSGSIQGNLTWMVPTGPDKGTVTISRVLTMSIKAHGSPNGITLQLEISGQQKRFFEMAFH